jgi:adenylate kinase family enzyme
MKDFVIFTGAPASGKTTVAELLWKETKSPLVDFGDLRAWHLEYDWSNANPQEEEMAFANLLFVLKNYADHGYKNVLVTDLRDDVVIRLANQLSDSNVLIVSLALSDEEELKKRVQSERGSGFKNVGEAIKRNRGIIARTILQNEIRLDNSHNQPSKTMADIIRSL